MQAQRVETWPATSAQRCNYRSLSLIQLAERIVDSDRLALKELHDCRPLFRPRSGESILLAKFIERLCETRWAKHLAAGNHVLLEDAHDLTVDKYAHIPTDEPCGPEPERRAPDCRNAFRSFLRVMDDLAEDGRSLNPIQLEILAAKILQRHVVRSFEFSCLDARRSAIRGRSRYAWHVNGTVIYVWMPTTVQNLRRRAWLEENIPDADPSRPEERHRIQRVIDDRLGIANHVSIETNVDAASLCHKSVSPPQALIEQEVLANGLASVVAEEKAENIDAQRPAIRALGKSRLKQLILQIFDCLTQGAYEEKQIASAFGVSGATFSRFAGSRWRANESGRIPDLWANTAQTLADHESFIEAAEEAGVWDNVELVLAHRQRPKPGSRADV